MITQKLGDYRTKLKNDGFVLTKFLDLEEQTEIKSLESIDVVAHFFGGFMEAERKRCLLTYVNHEVTCDQYQIVLLTTRYPDKFKQIGHRNVLGSLMALGVDRNTIGDIVVQEGMISFLCIKEMADFFCDNLIEINHTKIHLQEKPTTSLIYESDAKVQKVVVPSMRLDAILAKTLGKSRTNAQEMISSGFVMINYKETKNTCVQCKEKDIISIRHFGRINIRSILGETKKENVLLELEVRH
jgi:RNA-binding protein YlmH